jgi:hypothetical protein
LDETIFLSAPDGIQLPNRKCLQVLKNLYGLKQAGRNWNQRCERKFVKIGFIQSQADPYLFTHSEKRLIVVIYINNIIFAAPTKSAIQWFKERLSGLFKIKDLGEIRKVLGVRVTRDRKRRTITLDQAQYMEEVCRRAGITTAKQRSIPIPLNGFNKIRATTDDNERTDRREYQQIIGGLLYRTIYTRPNIAIALGKLSQFLSNPTVYHAEALKELLHYIIGSLNRCIRYGGSRHDIVAYSDADWANDRLDRKSVSGGVIMFNGGPISWHNRKQKTVSTSSTEAEYVALASMAKQI